MFSDVQAESLEPIFRVIILIVGRSRAWGHDDVVVVVVAAVVVVFVVVVVVVIVSP